VAKSTQPAFKEPQVKYKIDEPVLLDCPKCHSFISAEDIDLHKAIAICSHCTYTFKIEDHLAKDPHRRPEQIMPDSTDVLKLTSMLDIIIDWYKAAPKKRILGLIGGAFFWNILLVPLFIFLALRGELFMVILLAGHVLTGLSLLWYLLASLINKTHIVVTGEGISIRHTPLPTFHNKSIDIPRESIKQLYVTRYTEKIGKNKNAIQAYSLSAILKSNKVVELLKGMDQNTQLYLEQKIENYLGIKDYPIKGEVSRV
jgi:uncharacterized Fe-S cluster protein YjdI